MNHIELHRNYPYLSSKDIDIYCVVLDLIYEAGYNGILANPKELEDLTGTTERTIRKNIHTLINSGLIQARRHGHSRLLYLENSAFDELMRNRPP